MFSYRAWCDYGGFMQNVKEKDLQENVEFYMEKIAQSCEPMMVIRKNNKNVVLLSEGAYNNLIESKRKLESMNLC